MYKTKLITKNVGTAQNQEIYEWLTAECSDLFDSITIDGGQTRVSCKIGESEVLGFASSSSYYHAQVYWKNSAVFSSSSSSHQTKYFRSLYRINNGLFISMKYNNNYFIIPAVGIIKTNDDIFFINSGNKISPQSASYEGFPCGNGNYLKISSDTSLWYYTASSYNEGNGAKTERNISNYYHNLNDTASLVQMRCTNDYGTLIPGVYWLKKTPTRGTGLITINGKEYFSNGVFCILNE